MKWIHNIGTRIYVCYDYDAENQYAQQVFVQGYSLDAKREHQLVICRMSRGWMFRN